MASNVLYRVTRIVEQMVPIYYSDIVTREVRQRMERVVTRRVLDTSPDESRAYALANEDRYYFESLLQKPTGELLVCAATPTEFDGDRFIDWKIETVVVAR